MEESYLPEMKGMTQGIRNGRNVYEGYQRGWGLQFGGLREKVLADPLYQEAFNVARDRTIMSEENRMNIYLLLRFYMDKIPFGHIVEYGSYRGGSAIFMAYVAQKLYPGMKVFALDSYEGMPPTDKDVDAHNAGDFGDGIAGGDARDRIVDRNAVAIIKVDRREPVVETVLFGDRKTARAGVEIEHEIGALHNRLACRVE